jgi:hypothetical protein
MQDRIHKGYHQLQSVTVQDSYNREVDPWPSDLMQVKIDKVIGELPLVDGQGEHNKDDTRLRLVQVLEKLVKGQMQ